MNNNSIIRVLFLLIFSLLLISGKGLSIQNTKKIIGQEAKYLENIDSLKYKFIHEKCIELCKKACAKYPYNTYFNEVLCEEYLKTNKWEQAIKFGNAFNKIDSTASFKNYNILFKAYCNQMKYWDALKLSEDCIQSKNKIDTARANINYIKIKLFINYFVSGLLIIFVIIFFYRFIKSPKNDFRGNMF